MGHIRLGRLPKTKQWRAVFDALEASHIDPACLAAATANAAADRFEGMKDDTTLQHALWLLARVASAARVDTFEADLQRLTLDTARIGSGIEFVAEFARVLRRVAPPESTLAEIAIRSVIHVLGERLIDASRSLFGVTLDDIRVAVAKFGTDVGFADIARDFFADFSSRTIRFLAERELSNYVGSRRGLENVDDTLRFSRDVDRYCRESAEVIREFAKGWYSKANWQTGREIDPKRTQGFLAYSLTKLRDEIGRGGAR